MTAIIASKKAPTLPVFRRTDILTSFAVASIYAAILGSLPVDAFMDRDNYLVYADSAGIIFDRYAQNGVLSIVLGEPLWLAINILLRYFFDSYIVVRIIVFTSAFVVSFNICRNGRVPLLWALFIILLIPVVKNHIIHLRQGMAVAFFLSGWFATKPTLKWSLLIASAFVHVSCIPLLAILLFQRVAGANLVSPGLRLLAVVIFGLAIAINLQEIATISGIRQADVYNFSAASISGAGFLFWAIAATIMIVEGDRFRRENFFAIGCIAIYLSCYFFVEVSARIFESAVAIIFLSAWNLSGWRKSAFLCLSILFSAYLYYSRLGLPWLGFGADAASF